MAENHYSIKQIICECGNMANHIYWVIGEEQYYCWKCWKTTTVKS